jgi:bacteriorhodopsin
MQPQTEITIRYIFFAISSAAFFVAATYVASTFR